MDYHILREIADSWVLLAMTTFYVGAILWAFRPGSRATHEDVAGIPLRNETLADDKCAGDCADCSCADLKLETN